MVWASGGCIVGAVEGVGMWVPIGMELAIEEGGVHAGGGWVVAGGVEVAMLGSIPRAR